MSSYLKILPLLIFLTFLSACCPMTSINPLSNPDKATFDERLQGTWQLQKEDDTVFLHIGKLDDNKTQVVSVEHTNSGKLETMVIAMFPTKINGNHFMNLDTTKVEFIEPSNETPPDVEGYYFIKYDFKDRDTFSFSLIDEKVVAEAIKSGQLKGTIKYKPVEENVKINKVECVTITDNTENLIKFFSEAPLDKLFPEKDSSLFKRVK